MNPFRASQKTQDFKGQNPYLTEPSAGVCLQNTYDYSPFGVSLDGRTMEGRRFRYGFMGYEGDNEVKGVGNTYNTEFRQYDARLGRWLSLDPRQEKYSYISSYVTFANNPILIIDSNGDTIRLHGEDPGATLIEIQKATSLVISMDESGRLAANVPEGAALTKLDNAILTAIKDKKVNVNLYTTKSEWYNSKDGSGPYPIVVGGMEGSEIINGKVETTQIFNLEMANKLEAKGLDKSGNAAIHEILESYYGGVENPGGGFEGYESAHKKAEAADDYNPGTTMYQEKHADTGISDFGMAKDSKKAKLGDSSSLSKSKIFKKP